MYTHKHLCTYLEERDAIEVLLGTRSVIETDRDTACARERDGAHLLLPRQVRVLGFKDQLALAAGSWDLHPICSSKTFLPQSGS